jgi:M6 family metalloprotease-like protein/MYXO-CTERM domain-containing protein
VSSFVAPAKATIIWEGKVVEAWPDLPPQVPVHAHANGAQAAVYMPMFPHPSGVVRGLTIIVDFSDQPAAYTKADVEAWLNEAGFTGFGLKGSIRDYFLGQSNGKVDYQNEVHGFYRAPKPKSYYEDPNASGRAKELLEDAVAALDGEIDYSKFDNDGDGKTEAISLLYAGGEGTFAKGLWPHAGGTSLDRDGVRLSRYMMTAMNSKPTNYVFAHESGHMVFSWPDLYGVGDYCIMANRGSNTNPVGINDMYRADQGWIDVVDIDASTNARLSTVPDGAVYRFFNPARPTEQFVWSNLQNQKEWESIDGSGLLVWHFDKSIRGNNPPDPLQLAVVQAGGNRKLAATTWPSPGSAKTDLFAQGGNSELGGETQPSTRWNDGSPSGLRIYDISAPGPTMLFSVGTGPLPPEGTAGSAGSSSAGSGGTNGGQNGSGSGGSSGLAGSSAAGSPSGGVGSAGAVGGAPAAAGTATTGLGVDGNASPASADAGCACRVGAQAPSRHAALTGMLVAAWLLVNRRRHRRESHGA